MFTVNEYDCIDNGRLEWATDANAEHIVNDVVGRVCACACTRVQLPVGERPSLYATGVLTQFLEAHRKVCVTAPCRCARRPIGQAYEHLRDTSSATGAAHGYRTDVYARINSR